MMAFKNNLGSVLNAPRARNGDGTFKDKLRAKSMADTARVLTNKQKIEAQAIFARTRGNGGVADIINTGSNFNLKAGTL